MCWHTVSFTVSFVFLPCWWLPMWAKLFFRSPVNFKGTKKLVQQDSLPLQYGLVKQMFTSFSAWEDPVYLLAQKRPFFVCSLKSLSFAVLILPPICLLLFTLCLSCNGLTSVSSHSTPQFGNFSRGSSICLCVLLSKPWGHSWRSRKMPWLQSCMQSMPRCRWKKDCSLFPWLQLALHFFFQVVQSCRCLTASLSYALSLEAVCDTVLAQGIYVYFCLRTYKRMGFEGGENVQTRTQQEELCFSGQKQ